LRTAIVLSMLAADLSETTGMTAPTRRSLGLAAAALALAIALPAAADDATPITIFAAASTSNAVNEIAALYEAEGHGAVRPVFAASSTLAKQIDQGAPADLFLSANVEWMDYLASRHLLEPGSRSDLLANRLVLVAPADSVWTLEIAPGFDLAGALGDGRLALGDPGHVPAGLYAKAALEALGIWDSVAAKTAHAANVRAALALVESGAVPAGIVYESDAVISRRTRVVARFPVDSHPPIVYPLAVIAGHRRPEVLRLRDFLNGDLAAEVFRRHGFIALAAQAQG